MEKLIIQRSKSAQVQPWKARQRVWDCGSSLYDSLELESLRRRLDSACHSRTLSLPHLTEQPQPPPKLRGGGSRISRSLKKLVRSVFHSRRGNSKSGKAVALGSSNTNTTGASELSESDRYMARSVSMRFLHVV